MEYTYHGAILTSLSAIARHPSDENSMPVMGLGGIMQSKTLVSVIRYGCPGRIGLLVATERKPIGGVVVIIK